MVRGAASFRRDARARVTEGVGLMSAVGGQKAESSHLSSALRLLILGFFQADDRHGVEAGQGDFPEAG